MTTIDDTNPWHFVTERRDSTTNTIAIRTTHRSKRRPAPFNIDAMGWIIPATDDGVALADSFSDALAEAATISKTPGTHRIAYLGMVETALPAEAPGTEREAFLRDLIESFACTPITWDALIVRPDLGDAEQWQAVGFTPVPEAPAFLRLPRLTCLAIADAA